MANNQNMLFKIDTIVVDGLAIAFEDGSGEITNAAGFENEVVASATGDDFEKRKRVPRSFKTKMQFNGAVDPDLFANMTGVQISARDTNTGKRALMPKCSFAKMGAIGTGSVEIEWNLLAPIQWL